MQAININNPEVEVGSEHFAAMNLALWGKSGILPVFDKMAATIVNGSLVVGSGIYSNQGYELEIPDGETESFTIVPQNVGKRYDLLVSELSRDGEGVETHTLKIVSGTAATTPIKPALTQGDFLSGENLRQEAVATLLVDSSGIIVESMADRLAISGGSNSGRNIFVQASQPSSAITGDLWFW